jgi:hypothetical protein
MAQLYKFRTEIDEWRFNDSKRVVVYSSQNYDPCPIKRNRWEQGVTDQEIQITIPMDIEPAFLFIVHNPSHPLWLDVIDPSVGSILMSGKVSIAEHALEKAVVTLRFRAFSEMFSSQIPGRTFGNSCPFALFDEDCKVDENEAGSHFGYAFRYEIPIADPDLSISENGLEYSHPNLVDFGDGFFTGGELVNGSEELLIISHVGDTIIVLVPFVRSTNPNLRFRAGCDKAKTTCKTKFFPPSDPSSNGNLRNFGGCANIPRKNVVKDGF